MILLSDEEIESILAGVTFGAYDNGKLLDEVTYLQVMYWIDTACKIQLKKVLKQVKSLFEFREETMWLKGSPRNTYKKWQSFLKEVEDGTD